MEIKSRYVVKYKIIDGIVAKFPLHHNGKIYFNGDKVVLKNHPSLIMAVGSTFKIEQVLISLNSYSDNKLYATQVFDLKGLEKAFYEYIYGENITLYKRPLKNWLKYIKMVITGIYVP